MPGRDSTGYKYDVTVAWNLHAWAPARPASASWLQARIPETSVTLNGNMPAAAQRPVPGVASRRQPPSPPNANAAAAGLHLQPAASLLGLLESLRCGGFLLDARGRVLSLNGIAHHCLGDGLVLSAGQLRASDRATDQGLQRIVGAALGDSRDATRRCRSRSSAVPGCRSFSAPFVWARTADTRPARQGCCCSRSIPSSAGSRRARY